MKLLSAIVRNYRTHRETQVDLDDTLMLIHGPNESGKSTLAEAIHCALFLKAKGNTNFHKAMESVHGGTPEVELSFESGGKTHTLRKTFGSSGKTILECQGQATLNDNAAEDCLAALLGVDGSVSGGGTEAKMQRRWGHLWIWQGKSSDTPLDSIDEAQDQLRDKLQLQSGQSIISSATDNAVIEALSRWEEQTFTTRGPKTGSDLDKAEKALSQALEKAQSARSTLEQLQQAATNYQQAEEAIKRHTNNLSEAEAQLKTIESQLKTVEALRDELKDKTRLREESETALKTLKEADEEIRAFESQLKEAEKEAAPQKQALEAAGGKAGNTALRQQLGWDEQTYETVKQLLLNNSFIQTGRGRGGSVSTSNS